MKCKDCTAKCVFRNDSNPDAGCDLGSLMDNLMQQQSTVDWDAFRREVAKSAMLGILAGTCSFKSYENLAEKSIEIADALIKQLKEEKG